MEKKISIKTLYLIGVISIGLVGLAVGSTYAMFTSSIEINNPISINTNLSSENDIIDTFDVVIPAGELKVVPLNITNSNSYVLNYACFYITDSTNIEAGISHDNSDSNVPVGTISSNTTKKVYTQLKNNSSSSITVTVGVISSSNSIVKSDSMILFEDVTLFASPVNLATYITNLYTTSTKNTTTVNSITYNLASSVGLMNDRLASSSTNIDSGNIRYYGSNPNNYIYFNCSDYSNQTSDTCELWRIIGVFNGKVKIMRNSSIGTYSWDNKNTSTGAETDYGKNDWTTARLMKLLNPSSVYTTDTNDQGYGQSLYWNASSGTCYSGYNNATKACDFTTTGLKNSATRNLISESTWSIRGNNTTIVYADQIYEKEKTSGTVYSGRPTSWTGYVALAYPSDYGYAVDLSKCNQTLYNYDNSTCTSNNWMKKVITNNDSNLGWLLTPGSGSSSLVWGVSSGGNAGYNSGAYSALAAAPVLYLNSEQAIGSGNGSNNLPFQLTVT